MILFYPKQKKHECNNIAILLASYNGADFIREQLDSLMSQSFQDWSLFIHDDGSNDGTVEIIHEYEEKFPNKIFIIQAPSTGGAKHNFMFLLNYVDAPYIMFCDQDDVWLKNKIELTLNRMKSVEYNKPALVYSDLFVVDQDLVELSPSLSKYSNFDHNKKCSSDYLAENVVTGCTVMINRKLRNICIKATDLNKIVMHDWWIALVASKFGVISFISKSLVLYRQHLSNSVGARKKNLSYFFYKLSNIDLVLNSLAFSKKQARYLSELFDLNSDDVISIYGNIDKQSKISRILFYTINKIRVSGLLKSIALLVLG